jgi:aspartate racemase
MRTLGVIGGMGPAATFDFCARLTAAVPAARDQDHPRILVDCDPQVPDRNAAARGEGASPGAYIAGMARRLVTGGAEVLAMPCNTAHAYRSNIEAAASAPFVDMIAAAVDDACAEGVSRIGVLAADGCIAAGLYQDALAARGGVCLLLTADDQVAFMRLLYRIKAGDLGADARAGMAEFAAHLIAQGAAAVIAGCTEVPLVLGADDVRVRLVNSTDSLVRATLAKLAS